MKILRAFAALMLGAALAAAPVSAFAAMDESMDRGAMKDAPAKTMQHGGMDHSAMDKQDSHEGMDAKDHDHEGMMQEVQEKGIEVGIEERLGQYLPMDAVFTDSEGRQVALGDVVDAPTLLLPIYYTCPNVCHILQGAVARVLPKVALEPGRELKVVSLSFDERDTPEAAARARNNFTTATRGGFPREHWRFLTGDMKNIHAAMDAVGFRFRRVGDDFAHAVVAIAVAPDGKIVRYLYGSDFLPFDVTMAAMEAAKGTPGISVKRLLSYCYNYDPKGRVYAFDILRVSGITVLSTLGLILGVLLLSGRKKRKNR